MLAPEGLREVRDLLTERDFYRRDHQLIWHAICDLADREQPFDTVLLINWFENQRQLELVGDGAYLVELASTTPSAANIRGYAEVVRNKALLRGVIERATEITNDAYRTADEDADALVAPAIIAFVVNSQPQLPSQPLRERSKYTSSPTTTGGSAMPA